MKFNEFNNGDTTMTKPNDKKQAFLDACMEKFECDSNENTNDNERLVEAGKTYGEDGTEVEGYEDSLVPQFR